jgi:hypothetical protein
MSLDGKGQEEQNVEEIFFSKRRIGDQEGKAGRENTRVM